MCSINKLNTIAIEQEGSTFAGQGPLYRRRHHASVYEICGASTPPECMLAHVSIQSIQTRLGFIPSSSLIAQHQIDIRACNSLAGRHDKKANFRKERHVFVLLRVRYYVERDNPLSSLPSRGHSGSAPDVDYLTGSGTHLLGWLHFCCYQQILRKAAFLFIYIYQI